MTGYVRQSAASIVNGLDVTAGPLNAEFNRLVEAFDKDSGHNHDGSAAGGKRIPLAAGVTGYLPAANGGSGGANNLSASVDPSPTDDSLDGYVVGSFWANASSSKIFICLDSTASAAVWLEMAKFATNGDLTVPGKIDADSSAVVNIAAPSAGTDAANKAYVDAAIADLVSGSPGTLDTLNELAAALGDDPNYATTISTQIGGKLSLSGGTMTGTLTMGGNPVTGLPSPSGSTDAVRLQYITDLFGNISDAATSASEAEASALEAESFAQEAADSAEAAALFDPSSYYIKTESDDRYATSEQGIKADNARRIAFAIAANS